MPEAVLEPDDLWMDPPGDLGSCHDLAVRGLDPDLVAVGEPEPFRGRRVHDQRIVGLISSSHGLFWVRVWMWLASFQLMRNSW